MLDPDHCYAAIERRDPAMDGLFFTAVRTTRIYCRPVCPARTPARGNVAFYPSAAAAQAAGYRPCLRCRPEAAPDSPAWAGTLASIHRALRLIDDGALADGSVAALAERLGMSDRHLRRLFVEHLGLTPLAIEATRRLHLAKHLVHDTRLPLTDIAFAAGYGSVRRFNEAFQAAFARAPSALRRDGGAADPAAPIAVTIAHRPGFDWGAREALDIDLPEGRATVTQGQGRTLRVTLDGVPLPALGRAIAAAKRAVFASG
ncbi:Ada metal-binding domain-containing protein [Sphingomonas sp. 2R-10]|uniref:bifunctional transcriptional activator/DNA repair enzyme AdaA n=1 Tax=Sphingomonas sp. 2R-10 TaxID=3045148 RepID=UPI000F7AF4C5|nr:Ada metal-binding domain-containing protein [Sphingomonas sp. 2R-10]MDJ0277393.1 Ada metal-binding domain-containing protein [Sphingomonas sp. 2R-10]